MSLLDSVLQTVRPIASNARYADAPLDPLTTPSETAGAPEAAGAADAAGSLESPGSSKVTYG